MPCNSPPGLKCARTGSSLRDLHLLPFRDPALKRRAIFGFPSGTYVILPLFPALKCVRENWVVPPGLRSFFPLFPALKRWAKFSSPLRGWILELFVPPDRQNVSSHAHTEALG